VASSDPLGILASPVTIINRNNTGADITAVVDIAKKYDVERVIVGLPISLNGSLGTQANKAQEFAERLKQAIDVPVEMRDERLTTVEAQRLVKEVRKTSKDTRYDAAAAALILQSYLDSVARRETEVNEEP
jgi:putative holliday junction resolvase